MDEVAAKRGMADLSDAQWDYVRLLVEWQQKAEWMDVGTLG
jgi:hypothetical protein